MLLTKTFKSLILKQVFIHQFNGFLKKILHLINSFNLDDWIKIGYYDFE